MKKIVVPTFEVGDIGRMLKEDTEGELYGREAEYLYQTAERHGPGRYAELGAFLGLSTTALARGILDSGINSTVDSVDTFAGDGLSPRNMGRVKTLEEVQSHLNSLGLAGPVTLHQGFFTEVATKFEPETFDFIFIDGSHDYKSAVEDFVTWAPLLKVGGELAFHDATTRSKGKQVWRLMCKMAELGWTPITTQRTTICWQKTPESRWEVSDA